MTRTRKILTIAGASTGALILLILLAAVIVVQTAWFRNYVQTRIITTAEESTGGRVELASFAFSPWRLQATLDGFVLHGTEPVSAPPLFRARRIQLGLSLFSGLTRVIDLRYLTVDEPSANVIVAADGTTNLPSPRIKKRSDKTALETIVDLAVGRYDVRGGTVLFADKKLPLSAKGENLRARLDYSPVSRTYTGEISMRPVIATYGTNRPIEISVTVPLTLEKDRIAFEKATIATSGSQIAVSGAIEHLVSPRVSGRANVRLALTELRQATGLKVSSEAGKSLPGTLTGEVAFETRDSQIRVSGLSLALGGSKFEAPGPLSDAAGGPALAFSAHLSLGQLGKLFELPQMPEGTIDAGGHASLQTPNYSAAGTLTGDNVSIVQSGTRYRSIRVSSAFSIAPGLVQLNALDLRALGGTLTGSAALENMTGLRFKGNLQGLELTRIYQTLRNRPLNYSGVISGPVSVEGNLKARGASGLSAYADLRVNPGPGGVPVSGSLKARYDGATDNIEIEPSNIDFPRSRLALSGSLNRQLNVDLHSTNLDDFLPAVQSASAEPVKELPARLRGGGTASFAGALRGRLSSPEIFGHLSAANLTVEGRDFDRLTADIQADAQGVALTNASIRRGGMQIQADAKIGLANWKTSAGEQLNLRATVRQGDVADLLALAGRPEVPVTGTVTADIRLSGTLGSPDGTAHVVVTNGMAYEQLFQQATADVTFSDRTITVTSGDVLTKGGAVRLSGSFTHPKDSYATGDVQAQVHTQQLRLDGLRVVEKYLAELTGVLDVNAQVAARLSNVNGKTQFLLTAANGDMNVRNLEAQGEKLGSLAVNARTSGAIVRYSVTSDLAGSSIRAKGETSLEARYPTTASGDVSGLPIERILALVGKGSIPVRGVLAGNLKFDGTVDNPNVSVDAGIEKAAIYGEPLDRIEVRAAYTNQALAVPRLELRRGASRLNASLTYSHVPGDLRNGQLKFQLASSEVKLDQLNTVQQRRPGLEGTLTLDVRGAAAIQRKAGGTQVQLTGLDGNAALVKLAINGTNLGDSSATAKTSGDRLDLGLTSNLAGSQIAGKAQTILRDGYPTNADLRFTNLAYGGLRPLLLPAEAGTPLLNISADGQLTVSGPAANIDELTGKIAIDRLEASSRPIPGGPQKIALRNDGPLVVTLDRSIVKVQQAKITGDDTSINLAGTAELKGAQPLDLSLTADSNLSILQQMTRDIYSSGKIDVKAAMRGTLSAPRLVGRLELKDASINYIDFPNGLSHANGVILFSGSTATIQNLTAESGGGKIAASGFVSYGSRVLRYGLKATAKDTRVRYPPGASIVADANVSLIGTSRRSLLSGTVTLERIGFSPRSDFGSLLSQTTIPTEVPAAPSGPLAGMQLDIAVRTASDVSFQTSLAQNIEATADLHVRGTATNPGMLGRVNITEGQLVFFGNKYSVNQGSVSFFDPTRIRPVLNVDLQTQAKGVTVVLNVSGPMDNLKLTHRSDPPLQFNEIVALLATGSTPTSDPNLVAQQPAAPPQSLQQIGESAIVSQAIANPVSNRLARVFGVSQLKIDPTFVSGSELPQARLTLQQQITSNLTFTYVTNLNQTNSQIVRIEWAFSPQWIAVATREETGRFGVDFFYKKSFR
jgi:translocation and assembly module TamB